MVMVERPARMMALWLAEPLGRLLLNAVWGQGRRGKKIVHSGQSEAADAGAKCERSARQQPLESDRRGVVPGHRPTVTWLRRIGAMLVAIATLVVVAECFVFRPPEPKASFVIDRGVLFVDGGAAREATLPLHSTPNTSSGEPARFVARFDLPAPEDDLFLLIPTPNRSLRLALNGKPLFDSGTYATWVGPAIGAPIMLRLPVSLLAAGENELSVEIEGENYFVSLYLPKIYLGTEAALAPSYRLYMWINERLKTISLGVQVLVGLGIIFTYFYRRKDPLLSWLAGMMAVSFAPSAISFAGFTPGLHAILPYAILLSPAVGLFNIGVACGVSGVPAPKAAAVLAFVIPAVCAILMLAGIMPTRTAPAAVATLITVASFLVATAIAAWGALWRGSTEARVMLAPYVLLTAFMLRDISIGLGFLERPLISTLPFVRPVFLLAIFAVLMRRLVISLDRLDSANDNLNRRLEEQEAQLDVLHSAEQVEASRRVREHERQRLTRDLHDGISGHLVSIIAMTEGEGTEAAPIEQAARRALDDLRLVIYSLDLGEHDLPLALANFRERLIPQLQRAGVELDWSTAGLPEVSGITPSNALSILRILQEALTNALKHGPARKIVVRGEQAEGMAAITVENDGRPFVESDRGFGLANMRRRAGELRGKIRISALDRGTRLSLLLPADLPDMGNPASNEMAPGSFARP